ncbi:MAG: Gfo/Idh/MocA family oxidoreductase [Polyangia bacterium]
MSLHRKDERARVRLAVMGAGRWGERVVRSLGSLDEVELVAVADPDPGARARAESAAPRARVVEDVFEIIEQVEAVAVCTPTGDHVRHAGNLLERGVDVMLEKPMATEARAARELERRADEAGRVMLIGHQLLYHPGFELLRELISEGALGRLMELRSTRCGPAPLERECGVLWSYAPHDVAMMLSLTGEEPLEVSCEKDGDAGGYPVAARIELSFAADIGATISLDGGEIPRVRRLTALGDRGAAVFDDSGGGGRLLARDSGDARDETGWREVAFDREAPLLVECRHFAECVAGRLRPRTDPRHGAAVTEVIEKAEREAIPRPWRGSSSTALS